MFSGITRHSRAMVTAVALLAAAALLPAATAKADSQDDKFFALLGQKDIPPVDNANSLIETGHKVCGKLDGGMSVGDLVELIRNNGFNANPRSRFDPPDRITRTINLFITAAVQAYCPYDAGKIASISAYHPPRSDEPAYRFTAHTHRAAVGLPVLLDGSVFMARRDPIDPPDRDGHDVVLASLIGTLPSGEIAPTNPRPVPAQPPPPPQVEQPAPQQAPPPPPRRVRPVPQQAPPQPAPPQQAAPPVEPPPPEEPPPPAEAPPEAAPPGPLPQPGRGNNSGPPASPAPPPERPSAPGFIQLAP